MENQRNKEYSIINLQNEIYLGRFTDETPILTVHLQLRNTQPSVPLFYNCVLMKINVGTGPVTRKYGQTLMLCTQGILWYFSFPAFNTILISGSYLPATFSKVFTEFLYLQNNLSYLCSGLRIFPRSSGNFTQRSFNISPSVSSLLASFLLKDFYLECSIVNLKTSRI